VFVEELLGWGVPGCVHNNTQRRGVVDNSTILQVLNIISRLFGPVTEDKLKCY